MWEIFLANVATALNVTPSDAGIILSLIFTAAFDMVIGATSGSGIAVVAGSLVAVIFFVAIEWFPIWTGAVMAITFGVLFTNEIRKQL